MRVLIAGAGVAGLTLAALLRQRGVEAVVAESRPSLQGLGYALGLWPLGSRVLKGLGLYGQFEEISVPLKRYSIADTSGRVLQTYPVELIAKMYGLIRMVRRDRLTDLLLKAAEGQEIRAGVALAYVRDTGTLVEAGFGDGTSESFDVVVACDGIHSRLRTQIFGDRRAKPLGWRGWAWWIDPASARNDTMTEYWQPGECFWAVYPARDVLCVFAGLRTGEAERPSLNELRQRLGRIEALTPGAMGRMADCDNVFSDAFYCLELPEWHRGRVALLGDAASAYFPFGGLGIGASMAMESAAVMADELSRTDAYFVPTALSFYEKRRRPRAAVFENASRSIVNLMLSKREMPQPAEILHHQRMMFGWFKRLLEEPI
jgi:FAD-dependent urate hydroxylase